MPDKVTLRFEGLPPNPNVTAGKHWAANYKDKQIWWTLSRFTAKNAYKGEPFERADIHYHISVGDNRTHDADNLIASLKAVQDGLKGTILVDDSIDHISSTYTFDRKKPRGFTITITKKAPV